MLRENIQLLVLGTPTEDPLLLQLEQAKLNAFDTGRGAGSSGTKSKPPLALNALSLQSQIERDAAYIIPGVFPNLTERLLSVLECEHDSKYQKRLESFVEGLVERVRAFFQPIQYLEVTKPCPNCGETKAYTTNECGEIVVRYALRAWIDPADERAYSECLACGQFYAGMAEVLALGRSLVKQSA